MKRQLDRRLDTGAPELRTVRAFLVSVDGQTVIAHYSHRRPSDDAHVWSVTKSVLSILVGIAVDDGDLRLNQTLAELLPAYRSVMTPAISSITLQQLLSMTAGLPGYGPTDGYSLSVEDTVGSILSYGLTTTPGDAFAYSNTSAHLVGAILTHATGRSVLDFAREKLFDPLAISTRPAWHGWDAGTAGSGFDKPGFGWGTDRQGIYSGCCWLKLTAPDMVKIGELYLNGGRWRGKQLVPAAWVRESTASHVTAAQRQNGDDDYGYLWWVGDDDGHHWYAAQGSYGRLIFVFPDLHLVVAVASDDSGPEDLYRLIYPVIDDIFLKPFI